MASTSLQRYIWPDIHAYILIHVRVWDVESRHPPRGAIFDQVYVCAGMYVRVCMCVCMCVYTWWNFFLRTCIEYIHIYIHACSQFPSPAEALRCPNFFRSRTVRRFELWYRLFWKYGGRRAYHSDCSSREKRGCDKLTGTLCVRIYVLVRSMHL
jgi:hypothetical protein